MLVGVHPAEELDELAPQRRRAPRAVAELSRDVCLAVTAPEPPAQHTASVRPCQRELGAGATETASVSRAIQSVLEQVGVGRGNRQLDPIGELEPGLLAHRVHAVDEVVDAAGAHEVVVEVEVERDREAVRRGDRPAVLALPLDEHLVARELVAGHADPALGRAPRSRRPGAPRGRHRAPCRASARAAAGSA